MALSRERKVGSFNFNEPEGCPPRPAPLATLPHSILSPPFPTPLLLKQVMALGLALVVLLAVGRVGGEAGLAELCGLGDGGRLEAHLAAILRPRAPGSPGSRIVREYIAGALEELWGPGSVELDAFTSPTPLGPKTFTNIVATADRTAPRKLVLACHYDSKILYGWTRPFPISSNDEWNPSWNWRREFVGATDSGFPCAAILQIAQDLTPYMRQQSVGAHSSPPTKPHGTPP